MHEKRTTEMHEKHKPVGTDDLQNYIAVPIPVTSTSSLRINSEENYFASCLSSPMTEMRSLRIGLEWFKNPDHTPFFIAQELGWFTGVGLEIILVEPTTHMDPIDEINAGLLELAITEPLHVISDRAEGHKVKGFARFLHTSGGVMYLKGKGISRPRDMNRAGLRIQYPGAPGPGGIAIVSSMIEADGGTCDLGHFKPVNNGFMHTDAIANDIADVATLVFANFELIEAKHRGLDVDYFSLKDYGIPDFNQLVLVSTEDCYANRREDIKLLVEVLHRAVLYIKSHPEESKRIYIASSGCDADNAFTDSCYDATVSCFTSDFSMSNVYYDSLNAWMFQKKITNKSVDVHVDPVWTNELVTDLIDKTCRA